MQTLITIERNNLVEGMDLNGDHDLSFCDGCVYGKNTIVPHFLWLGFSCKGNVDEPHSFVEILNGENSQHWKKAMDF
jgi:hypothetical protein